MKTLFCYVTALLVAAFNADAAQTSSTILLHATDSGSYDRYGERDPRIPSGLAGFSALEHVRGPAHSFLAFEIPNIPGTFTNASLIADIYCISPDGGETLELRDVTSAITLVRNGGLNSSNIYADLGEGTFYGGASFNSGNFYSEDIPLNASAVAALNAARGQQFAVGGALADANSDPIYNEYIVLPNYSWQQVALHLEASVPAQPFIYTQPPGHGPLIYSNAVLLTVGACGAAPLTYTWFVDGVTDGTRSYPDFYIPFLTATQQSVFVVVSNSFGSVTSVVLQVRADAAQFVPPFTNLTVRVGERVFIDPGMAIHAFPNTIEWRKDGVELPNADPYSYELGSAQLIDTGNYTVTVSNEFGVVTSPVMHLQVVEAPPVFWQEPIDARVPLGGFVYLSAEAKGGPPPLLRWYREGFAAPISGSNDFFYIPVVSNSEAGRYYVVASNVLGSVTSRLATVTTFLDPPIFTTQPESQVAYPGQTISFNAYADGQPYPALQWYFNGARLVGENLRQLTLYNVNSNNAGSYFCMATNASGVATSSIVTLTILSVPPVVSGPNHISLPEGSFMALTLIISNPPAHIRWLFNGVPIPGSESVTLSSSYPYFASYNARAEAGLYSAVVSNSYGFTTSRVAQVTVTSSPPGFETQPYFVPSFAIEGATATLYFSVTGAPPPQIFIYRNGIEAGPVTQPGSFTLKNLKLEDTGDYTIAATNRLGMATSLVARLEVQRAGPLDRWTSRNPVPQGNDLFAVTYGEDKFVAVGRNGTIVHSADGTNWNVRSIRTSSELYAVTYGGGRFVAGGEEGLIATSTNGESWVTTVLPDVAVFHSVVYAQGQFIVVGQKSVYTGNAAIFVSSNGLNWTNAGSGLPPTMYLKSVAYGNGVFVLSDGSSQIFRSTDLVSWTSVANGFSGQGSVRFLNGQFVVVGNHGLVAVSTDATTWTVRISITTRDLNDSGYGNSRYVAAGGRGEIHYSSDSIAWSPATPITTDRLEALTYASGLFVAVGENGIILTSADGENWANQRRGNLRDLDGLAAGPGLLMAVGKQGTVLTSPNGRDWTLQTMSVDLVINPPDWHGVGYGDGKWIVVGDSTNILSSTNAIDWEPHLCWTSHGLGLYLKNVIYAGGQWIAVGTGGLIVTSTDGTNWTEQASGTFYDLNEVTYGNGTYVIAGDNGPNPNATILVSTDGVTWNDRRLGTGKNLRAITFANGLFVGALNDGSIMFTTNADLVSTWQYAYTPIRYDGANLRGLTHSNGLWICVGNDGLILTSSDAQYWRRRISPTDQNLHAVRFVSGTFVAIGNAGTILQSDPLVSKLAVERAGSGLRLLFSTPFDDSIKLQQSGNFSGWQDIGSSPVTNSSAGVLEFNVPLPSTGKSFFRIVPQ